jgi:hypothetical protein
VAFGCVELLWVISRNAVTAGGAQSLALGAVSSRDILDAAVELRWITTSDNGLLTPTTKGERALSAPDNLARLRLLILDHIDTENPPWTQLATAGRRDVLLQAPKGVCQVLVEAGLAYGDDHDTVLFWDTLAARARGIRNAALTETGRNGERLSLSYERQRTGREPKWIALDSNADGYDILSRVSADDVRRLTIEVKTSGQPGLSGVFYITRNEWNLATESLHHVFHLWDVSGATPRLAVLNPIEVAEHAPKDMGTGEWESVRIPFASFKSSFSVLHAAGNTDMIDYTTPHSTPGVI